MPLQVCISNIKPPFPLPDKVRRSSRWSPSTLRHADAEVLDANAGSGGRSERNGALVQPRLSLPSVRRPSVISAEELAALYSQPAKIRRDTQWTRSDEQDVDGLMGSTIDVSVNGKLVHDVAAAIPDYQTVDEIQASSDVEYAAIDDLRRAPDIPMYAVVGFLLPTAIGSDGERPLDALYAQVCGILQIVLEPPMPAGLVRHMSVAAEDTVSDEYEECK